MPFSLQTIDGSFKGKDIISIDQFSSEDIEIIFNKIHAMKALVINKEPSTLLQGYVIALIFYEPSSRTFGSFSSAAKRLGAATIEYLNPQQNSSVAKGESLEDTMQTLQSYAEIIVMRHYESGAAIKAAGAASVPLINAGDGGNAHPTSTLLDLYTIYERFQRLTNLTVVISGDIVHSRTIKSLIQGLSLYKENKVYLLSPKELRLEKSDFERFTKNGIELIEIFDEKDIPKDANVWYWNRIQKERFPSIQEAEKYKGKFILTEKLLTEYGNNDLIILDPLPRVGEIELAIDNDPRSLYLKAQIRNSLYVRMALLALVLGKAK